MIIIAAKLKQKVYVPRTKAQVQIKDFDIKYIIGGRTDLTIKNVKEFIQGILDDTLNITIEETREWIYKYVPKRSGDLQESLLSFLEKSKPPPTIFNEIRGVRLVLGAGAEVKYVKYVDKFDDSNVQHDNTWREHSGKKAYSKGKPILLDDPQAKGQFFDKMVSYAKSRLRINLSKIKWAKSAG